MFTVDDYKALRGDAPAWVGGLIPSAWALLNELTCNAFTEVAYDANFVADSGMHSDIKTAGNVTLMAWATGKITIAGNTITSCAPIMSDVQADGTTIAYYRRAYSGNVNYGETGVASGYTVKSNPTLPEHYEGHFGFETVPYAVQCFLADLIDAMHDYAENYGITSKSIEDVSVSYDSSAVLRSPLEKLLPLYKRMLEQWSLCDNPDIEYGVAHLAYPYKIWDRPYWLGDKEPPRTWGFVL